LVRDAAIKNRLILICFLCCHWIHIGELISMFDTASEATPCISKIEAVRIRTVDGVKRKRCRMRTRGASTWKICRACPLISGSLQRGPALERCGVRHQTAAKTSQKCASAALRIRKIWGTGRDLERREQITIFQIKLSVMQLPLPSSSPHAKIPVLSSRLRRRQLWVFFHSALALRHVGTEYLEKWSFLQRSTSAGLGLARTMGTHVHQ